MSEADDAYGNETAVKRYLPSRQSLRRYPRIRWRDRTGDRAFLLQRLETLGSATSADIVVADREVSRIHAELDPREDGVWVRDLGSRNGTFIGDVRIVEGRIPPGAALVVGSTALSFDVVEGPSDNSVWPTESFGPLRGRSQPMRALFRYLSTIATSDASVLIRGETGTGKELVARAIHDASPRRAQPFVVVDCAAIPENLIESELFGSVRGAFTGAQTSRDGAIAAAEGGTVFFDEIGELPLAMQPKLLRVLEAREVRRLGETTARKVNVRFLAASHRDLRQMVNAGAFREDLYFRLAVIPVVVPALRERLEDLPLLVEHFLPPDAPPPKEELLRMLESRPWLGNVRELRNFVMRIAALGPEAALAISVLPPPPSGLSKSHASAPEIPPAPVAPAVDVAHDRLPSMETDPPIIVGLSTEQPFKTFRELWMDFGEREYVNRLLARHQHRVSAAASSAGLDRTYLYRLIRKHGR